MTTSGEVHKGACFCRSVSYEVTESPILSAYCHCTMCQRLNGMSDLSWVPYSGILFISLLYIGCPFVHTIHFPASAFSWTHEQPHGNSLDSFTVPEKPWKTRWRCKRCGAVVASSNSKANKWSIWGAQLERGAEGRLSETLKSTGHIFYETRMLDVDDALGKWVGYEDQSEQIKK